MGCSCSILEMRFGVTLLNVLVLLLVMTSVAVAGVEPTAAPVAAPSTPVVRSSAVIPMILQEDRS